MEELPVDSAPIRRFKDLTYVPLANTLAEIHTKIDTLDEQIISLIVQRASLVKDVTRFEKDSSTARQEEVLTHVRELTQKYSQQLPYIPFMMESIYLLMISSFVASEQLDLSQTEPISTPTSQVVDVVELATYQNITTPVIMEIASSPENKVSIEVMVDLQKEIPLYQIPKELTDLAIGWVTITNSIYRVSIMKKNVKMLARSPLVDLIRHPKHN